MNGHRFMVIQVLHVSRRDQPQKSPDILWKTTIKGIQSYVTAFNGKVLVTTATNVIALDKDTGAIIWNTTLPNSQTVASSIQN